MLALSETVKHLFDFALCVGKLATFFKSVCKIGALIITKRAMPSW